MIIRTEYANFGKPEDLLRYMQEENIPVVTVKTEYWGASLVPMKMTQKDVEDWVKMKGGVNELYSNSNNSNYLHNNIGVMQRH